MYRCKSCLSPLDECDVTQELPLAQYALNSYSTQQAYLRSTMDTTSGLITQPCQWCPLGSDPSFTQHTLLQPFMCPNSYNCSNIRSCKWCLLTVQFHTPTRILQNHVRTKRHVWKPQRFLGLKTGVSQNRKRFPHTITHDVLCYSQYRAKRRRQYSKGTTLPAFSFSRLFVAPPFTTCHVLSETSKSNSANIRCTPSVVARASRVVSTTLLQHKADDGLLRVG